MELVVFDLDGTLLNRDSVISDYTSETLKLRWILAPLKPFGSAMQLTTLFEWLEPISIGGRRIE